jgi:PTS system ascorbate-specific IIB component
MYIVCVCGLGMGSSLILKMTVDKAARELGIDAEVEHWDAGTVTGKHADLIMASQDFAERFAGNDHVILINNIISNAEVKEKLGAYVKEHNL